MELAGRIRQELGQEVGYIVSDEAFMSDGVSMVLTDVVDGQRYTLELRPLRTERGVSNV